MRRLLRGSTALFALVLAAATVAAFAPALRNGFMRTDDVPMVVLNEAIAHGPTPAALRWAFTTGFLSNWFPLTWISHAIDVGLFGLDPGGHHAVSILLHAVNAVLLFLVLARLTGSRGRSLAVAALFALHPLQVESVAWIAERKNVLSTLFWFLALAGYLGYVRRPGPARYLGVSLLFACGLLAKPMLVTLPLVLLLLDFWPLGRLREIAAAPRLLLEKVPLLLLSAASSVVTYRVQRAGEAVRSLEEYSLAVRIKNALVSYLAYLRNAALPIDLSPYYPHPGEGLAWGAALGAAAVLALVTAAALLLARRRPSLAVGWLWYLGVLVPVIGLVQVGTQALADRYAYVSLVGVLIMAAWSVPRLPSSRALRAAALAAGVALLGALGVATARQTRLWRDTATLAQATLRRDPLNWMAHNDYAEFCFSQGRFDDAIHHLLAAMREKPALAVLRGNLAAVLESRADLDGAIHYLRQAERLDPRSTEFRPRLDELEAIRRNAGATIARLEAVARTRPFDAQVRADLGTALFSLGRYDESARWLQEALGLNPAQPGARHLLEAVGMRRGRAPNAEELAFRAEESARAAP